MASETSLTKLGIKRKDLWGASECAPCSPMDDKKHENEIVYPELDANGPLAEQLGAEELKVGERFTQTVEWEVKRVRISSENGKKDYGLTLCMVAASGIEPSAASEEDTGESGEEEDSAAMRYIRSQAKE